MDATATGGAGAVAGIFGPRNPVRVARLVMGSPQVMIIGAPAEELARALGLPSATAIISSPRRAGPPLQETLALRKAGADETDPARRHGTVGAVALDLSW